MQDQVDLLNANDIVSISVNENRLKEVFLMMMTKLNHHATRILKLESNFKHLQQNTQKSIYTVQQRIQFNEKEAQNNFEKVYLNINENKNLQENINKLLDEKINNKDLELRKVKSQIQEIEINFDNKIFKSCKDLEQLSNNVDTFQNWKEQFEHCVNDKVEMIKEEIISIQARISFSFKGHDIEGETNQVPRIKYRNSDYITKKSYMPRASKMSNVCLNQAIGSNKHGNNLNLLESINETGQKKIRQSQSENKFVKEKLTYIEEQLERQRRIVDKRLPNPTQERIFTQFSGQYSKVDKLQAALKSLKRIQPGEQFRRQMLRAIKQMEGKMNDCKVPLELFNKAINGINEKLNFLQLLAINKCDKGQVKNAFTFLEKKLKELILIVTNNETQQKDAVITKQQVVKCLSCSHNVQKQSEKIQYNHWKTTKGKELNSVLEMRNDFRNLKISQEKKKMPRKNTINSFHDKRSRPQSKSMAFPNNIVTDVDNFTRQ